MNLKPQSTLRNTRKESKEGSLRSLRKTLRLFAVIKEAE